MTSRIEEMRTQIHATPMPTPPARARWRPRRRAGVIAGGVIGVGLAAAAAVLVVAVTDGSSAAPAFAAVFHNADGGRTVTITLRQEQDIPELNARLEAEHTRIRAVPIIRGCDAPVHQVQNGHVVRGPATTIVAPPEYLDGHEVYISQETISVSTLASRTLVLAVSKSGFLSGYAQTIIGPAPSCAGIGAPIHLPKSYPAS
jgi:hypothetical protein